MAENGLSNAKHVYFIGIGGISMSGLAMVLKNRGYAVSGSDTKASHITDTLIAEGIGVFIGQQRENIKEDVDLVVYTAAIAEDNPELLEANHRGIRTIPRSRLLGMIMEQFKNSVAVAGTHGKTTTTSMVSQILLEALYDPTISIGGIFPAIDGNIRIGGSEYFITEACEYTNSFLELMPTVAIILNIELDHIDYFKNMDEVYESFKGFVSKIKEGGAAVIYSGIENYESVAADKRIVTFGFNEGDNWRACNIKQNGAFTEFELFCEGVSLGNARMPLAGIHNVINALGACAAAHFLGVSTQVIIKAIEKFTGAKRRFEFKGSKCGISVYDDYAHHPSEIKATLRAARELFGDRVIWCVFQPHTFSRTKAFLEEFSCSFGDASRVLLADIYPAREKDPGDIHSKMLAEKINAHEKKAQYFDSLEKIAAFLDRNCGTTDVVITMGAGDIYLVGDTLLGENTL